HVMQFATTLSSVAAASPDRAVLAQRIPDWLATLESVRGESVRGESGIADEITAAENALDALRRRCL
ncbi:hypothetical protein G3I15_10745, partial [Streptomyces sp. SID10244]|nr:hypothetical protein [Streptomyces sp. SID10244]